MTGTLVTSHAEFGDSWLVPGSECSAVTEDKHPCDVAGYQVKRDAIEQCAIIQVCGIRNAYNLDNALLFAPTITDKCERVAKSPAESCSCE